MFDRRVTRVVTAGTLVDENFMDPFENNYLLGIHFAGYLPPKSEQRDNHQAFDRQKRGTKVGPSWIDLSSGDFYTQAADLSSLPSAVARIGPREIVLDSSMQSYGLPHLQKTISDANLPVHFHELPSELWKRLAQP